MSPGESRPRSAAPSPPAVRIYVGSTVVVTVALVALGYAVDGVTDNVSAVVVLTIFGMLGLVRKEIPLRGSRITMSLTSIVLLASAVILGPVGAAIVGLGGAFVPTGSSRVIVRTFNACLPVINGALGGLLILAVNQGVSLDEADGTNELLVHVALPLLLADVVCCVVNAVLLSVVVRLSVGVPVRAQVAELLTTSGPAYLVYGVIGFILAVLWIPSGVGPASTFLVMAPLIVARWAFAQYAEEENAHDRTLAALVTALERKDPRTAGHGARVADLCDWAAQSLQLGPREQQAVRTAGMLHDLGRIAVPSRVLNATEPLSDNDILLLADHPSTAVDMLQGIGFLGQALEAIAHHHERFDGLGYPDGLAGQDIPLGARIIAAADSFDALTTQRPYRRALSTQEAVVVLRSRTPDHLDPVVVEALIRGVQRRGWEPLSYEPDDPRSAATVLDHDDLEASDALAARADLRQRIRDRHATRGQSLGVPR